MSQTSQYSSSTIRHVPLYVTDHEVRIIFSQTRCYYRSSNGYSVREADGVFVREQRSREGTLGFVYRDPINGQNWLWVISKKTRKPFALAKVS